MNQPIREWQGKRVWVIGASSGIGAALAAALHARGASVAISARNRDALMRVGAGCAGIVVVPLDVTASEDHARAHADVLATLGGLDLVIFNAGAYQPARAWDFSVDNVRTTVTTNVIGTMEGVACVLPAMLARGAGALAIVASVAGYRGLPRATTYGPSKAALINFAETLYLDLAPRGISVFLINPGFVATPLTARNDFHMPALITAEEAAARILAGFASGRFETHFPKRFTAVLKLLALFPARLYAPLVRKVTGT